MKKTLILQLWIVTALLSNVFAQQATWPIKNKKAGERILYRPQDFIGEEFNFSDLYITAPYGSDVVSPISGKVSHLFYCYSDKLEFMYSFSTDNKPDDTRRSEIAKSIQEKYKKSIDPKFVSLSIAILSSDGSMYHISGLRPIKTLKTGMQINKGETIGTVGYVYKTIKESCIRVSRSVGGQSSDPMSPFGLRSTFIAPKIQKKDPKKQYTKEQLQEDFRIFRESLEEGHPGLYDYISKHKMDSLFDNAFAKTKDGMIAYEFYNLLNEIISNIHDSHTYLGSPTNPDNNMNLKIPSVTFGLFNDSLQITRVTDKINLQFVGKKIISIDGISADKLIKEIKFKVMNRSLNYEGLIESGKLVSLSSFFWRDYMDNYKIKNEGITLTLVDGTTKTFPNIDSADKKQFNYYPGFNYRKIPHTNITYKKIDAFTALMDINTFGLSESDHDSIRLFIKDISANGYKNLIIDVRNNPGGLFGDLFKYIAEKPFKTVLGLKVNQNDTYNFFKYCTNYSIEDRQLFQGYKKLDGKDGYYFPSDSLKTDYPCDSIHFSGKIYVLTNELSISAASIFAGLIHKYKRGVIVGRETGSAYQQLNAVKFANVNLKNTELSLRIPLVKCIYEYPENSDIPWGRGVLPDYPFNITLDELIGDKDTMLNYTLQLIKENKYLNEKTETKVLGIVNNKTYRPIILIGSIFIVIIAFLIYILRKKKREI